MTISYTICIDDNGLPRYYKVEVPYTPENYAIAEAESIDGNIVINH